MSTLPSDNTHVVVLFSDGTCDCPDEFRVCGERCYHLGPSPLAYAEAAEYCAARAAHLATPRSLPEDGCLILLVFPYGTSSTGGWLGYSGGTDATNPHMGADGDGAAGAGGSFTEWSALTYSNQCVALARDFDGNPGWYDTYGCDTTFAPLCQLAACTRAGCAPEF